MYPKMALNGSGLRWQSCCKTHSLKEMSINQLSAVVAVAKNGTIGRGNTLPWRLRSDLQRFKRLTMGHSLVMGRKTFESIGKSLPGRQTIVLTRQKDTTIEGVQTANSLEDAIALVPNDSIPFVVGGAEVYRVAMPMIRNLYLTRVLADIEGDAYFGAWDESDFDCIERSIVPADAFNEWPSEFLHLVRKRMNLG